MKRTDKLTRFFQKLQEENIYMKNDFVSDIRKLITSDVENFVVKAYRDLVRANLDYNRFEELKLTKEQRERMNGAFTEDGNKSKGKDSYKHNIERAVNIYESVINNSKNIQGKELL